MEKALVLGAGGQIGTELVSALRTQMGPENVWATDLHPEKLEAPFLALNALDGEALRAIVVEHRITQVYHLVAMLSATGEKMPEKAWELNMTTLFHVLNLAKEGLLKRVFWPSSIAAFGPNSPRIDTPQYSAMDPTTVYGISKLAGELWCQYYHEKYGVDVRSVRYPGLISWKTLPGGGTTDYAIDIFHAARRENAFTCFLEAHTRLPMMHMEDAIRATLMLMDAPADQVKVRTSYNLSGIDFTPEELATSLRRHYPSLDMSYAPDFRQSIAASWPQRVDDGPARQDWGWAPYYSLDSMVDDMVAHL